MNNCYADSVRRDVEIDMLNESRHGEYEILMRNLAKCNEAEFGLSDPKTLQSLNMLAVIVGKKNRFAESESIYRDTIEICTRAKEKQGMNAVYDTCASTAQNNLGCLLISNEKVDESFHLFKHARTLRDKVFGETTASSHDIVQNQANYEFIKGHYILAADLYRDSLRRKLHSATARNFRTCECERSLADSLYRAGNFVDSEAGYKRLLADLDSIEGVDHITSNQCRSRLASTLLRQEKLEEAEAVLRESLSIAESNSDSCNATARNIAKLKYRIAAILMNKKEYESAEKMYTEALPADMPEIHDALAQCFILQGKLPAANQFYTTLLHQRESSLGIDHPQTIHTVCAFGDLYIRRGNFTLALDSYQRALTVYERELGPDNILSLTAADNVGFTLDKMKRLAEADCMLSRALAGFEKILGAGHAQVAKTGRRLVSVYKQQNRPAEAESILTRILTFVTGMSEVEKIRIVNSIAILQKKQGKLMEAETMYLRAVNMYGLLGDDSLTVCREDHLATLNNLGLLYKTKKEFMLSRRYYDEAYSGRKEFFGVNHPETLFTMANIAVLLTDQNDLQGAETFFKKVLDGFTVTYGEDNTETKRALHNLTVLQKRKRSKTDP